MTCEYLEPPAKTPCYCTATHGAALPDRTTIAVCETHAAQLNDEGADVWRLEVKR